MSGVGERSWARGLMATQERRTTVLTLAVALNLVIVLLNLLDVFEGAPTAVSIAVLTLQTVLLLVIIGALVVIRRTATTRQRE